MNRVSSLLVAVAVLAIAGPTGATSQNHKSSKSNVKPLLALPAAAPEACRAAARQLDANGDLRLDGEIFSGGRRVGTSLADRCTAENEPWGRYLKARTLAAQGRYADAASEAERAEIAAKRCPPYCIPPRDRVGPGGYPPPDPAHIRAFRADALEDERRVQDALKRGHL